jgi:hypothetical protein
MSFQDDAAAEQILKELELLPRFSPDPARAARVRARCRARLERSRPSERAIMNPEGDGRLVTPVLFGCLCGAYVVSLFQLALRVYGVLE